MNREVTMSKTTKMMMMIAGVLFFVIIIGVNIGNRGDKDGWRFGNWGNENVEVPENVAPNDINEEAEADDEPQPDKQVTASTYEEGLEKAKEHDMPILIVFHANWCGWCTKMKETTLSDKAVEEVMRSYVFLSVDTQEDKKTTGKFKVRGLPSYTIVDGEGETLKKGRGYKDAEAFIEWLEI